MVTEHGRVKVLDFGLAKLSESAEPGENESTRTLALRTERGVIAGTVAYGSVLRVRKRRQIAREGQA